MELPVGAFDFRVSGESECSRHSRNQTVIMLATTSLSTTFVSSFNSRYLVQRLGRRIGQIHFRPLRLKEEPESDEAGIDDHDLQLAQGRRHHDSHGRPHHTDLQLTHRQ